MCGKASTPAHRPFCSAVCWDRDLIAWLDARYVVPGPATDAEAESPVDRQGGGGL